MLDFEEVKKSCEIWPCSALKLKMLNQSTRVPFMRIAIPKASGTRQNFLVNNLSNLNDIRFIIPNNSIALSLFNKTVVKPADCPYERLLIDLPRFVAWLRRTSFRLFP